MRKDITFEKLMLGGEKVNKNELARRYNIKRIRENKGLTQQQLADKAC